MCSQLYIYNDKNFPYVFFTLLTIYLFFKHNPKESFYSLESEKDKVYRGCMTLLCLSNPDLIYENRIR